MKILISTLSVTRTAGGVFDAVRDLFTNKEFDGIKREIISFKDDAYSEDYKLWGNIPTHLFKKHFFLYSPSFRKAMLESDADILHAEGLWRYPHQLISAWSKYSRKPVVCSPHGMLDPYIINSQGKLKRFISHPLFDEAFKSVSCWHALAQKELDDIRAYGLKQPVAIIPNGVKIPQESIHFHKIDDKKHLLYLGRLHKKKGVDLLIKALSMLNQEDSKLLANWIIDIVGWDDEGFADILKSMAISCGLNSKIIFHGGLFGEDKLRAYATCDGYILPSHGEGLPMTVLEAWSWKKPVIITQQCHLPEGGKANAAIEIDDNVESVKIGIRRFIEMSETGKHRMGLNGYNLVKREFTWDSAATKMINLYKWLLGETDKPSFVYM